MKKYLFPFLLSVSIAILGFGIAKATNFSHIATDAKAGHLEKENDLDKDALDKDNLDKDALSASDI